MSLRRDYGPHAPHHAGSLYLSPTGAHVRRLFTQYLLSYKLNPQTVFLLEYSDNASGTQSVDLTRTDRTLFLKLGYAWVR
jgi:hypothetical protein